MLKGLSFSATKKKGKRINILVSQLTVGHWVRLTVPGVGDVNADVVLFCVALLSSMVTVAICIVIQLRILH